MKSIVVVPVYNSPYIYEVIDEILDLGYTLIVVDDGSDEGVKMDETRYHLVTHEVNQGKGEAILSGAQKAKDLGYEAFITMDADKQHIGTELIKLIDAYKTESIVIGNRDFTSDDVPGSSKFGRKFSNFWLLLETFKTLGDTQSGFRMYPVSILELPLKNRKFDFEVEVLVLHSYAKKEIIDVEVQCYYPPHEERISHFDKWDDNVRITLLHIKFLIQKFLFLRGWLWK